MDDACPTMDRKKWQMMEDLLDEFGIKPIVAVVPDNQDPELIIDPVDPAFWSKVRSWQKKRWTIAMHGCTHLMRATDAEIIIPFHRRSEFAGATFEVQSAAIKRSWTIFAEQGVEPTVWVAPAHSFDRLTLEALKQETPIRIISDGIAADSYFEHDFHWVPQQLWTLRERTSGLWTACLHPNSMDENEFFYLHSAIRDSYSSRLSCIQDLVLKERPKGLIDKAFEVYFWQSDRVRRSLLKMRDHLYG